jgi:hypothetical protein
MVRLMVSPDREGTMPPGKPSCSCVKPSAALKAGLVRVSGYSPHDMVPAVGVANSLTVITPVVCRSVLILKVPPPLDMPNSGSLVSTTGTLLAPGGVWEFPNPVGGTMLLAGS